MEHEELIIDILKRIIKLEKEVELLKNSKTSIEQTVTENKTHQTSVINTEKSQRDKTRYMFNGNIYLKNKLVLAIVRDYVSKNAGITCSDLKNTFDKSLQGSIGVVEYESIAKMRYTKYEERFFAKEDEVLRLSDGNMLVCSQWGIVNISNFIFWAKELGYKIEMIKS